MASVAERPDGHCPICNDLLPEEARADAVFCSSPCRQQSYRDRRRLERCWGKFLEAAAQLDTLAAIAASRNADEDASRNGLDRG